MPHTVTESALCKEYKEHANKLPKHNKEHVHIVMLGGDAPQENGQMNYFTSNDLSPIINKLTNANKEKTAIWIFNGPRTGKHINGKEITHAHQTPDIDHVTAQAVKDFTTAGFTLGTNVHVHNFQFGTPSLYKAALGFLSNHQGTLYLPGESISMISEAYDIASLQEKIVIYRTSSMNHSHTDFIHSDTRFSILGAKTKRPRGKTHSTLTAADTLVRAIQTHAKIHD